jgi:exodeoxyribonuclease X
MKQAFVIDTETASLDGGVCDIAIALIDENLNVLDAVESLIDPERPISPSASAVHHITDEMVADKPTLAEFMEMTAYPFSRPNLVLCGHNVQFDIRACKEFITAPYTKLCTLKLARTFWPDAENHQLQTLRYMLKLEAGKDAHRAMGDVITCVNLMRYMADQYNTDLNGLIELSRAPLSLDTRFPFGKHKGQRLRDIPLSYVRWALDNMHDLDPDLREALASRI